MPSGGNDQPVHRAGVKIARQMGGIDGDCRGERRFFDPGPSQESGEPRLGVRTALQRASSEMCRTAVRYTCTAPATGAKGVPLVFRRSIADAGGSAWMPVQPDRAFGPRKTIPGRTRWYQTGRACLDDAGPSACCSVFGAVTTTDPVWAISWISIALSGSSAAAPVGSSLVSLIAPRGGTGTIGGIVNFANNLMGVAAPVITGFIVGLTQSFAGAFLVAGVVLVVGIFAYVVILGRIEPIPEPESG
jgi:hypothetical protein